MNEVFFLNGDSFHTMPVPHDCQIKRISLEDEYLVFTFENDINRRDPGYPLKESIKSLIIRYHLLDQTYSLYRFRKPFAGFCREGVYIGMKYDKLFELATGNLEYVGHYIGYNSIIIKMFSFQEIILEASVDRVEYEWIF